MEYEKPNFGPGVEDAGDVPAASVTERFDEAIRSVTETRGSVYGHPCVDFGRAAAVGNVVADCPDPRLRHVLYMIGVKLARLTETPDHLDSWVDIAGYARTACMVIDAQSFGGSDEG